MKAEEFLKLYKDGQRDFPGADLSEMDLTCEDLSGINLAGATLRKTTLCETNLANANFQNADLRDVEIIAETRGSNIDFSSANFEGTGMYEGIIEKANFSRANFKDASFAQYLMNECDFSGTDFTNAWLSETQFMAGRFKGAIFRKAYIDVNFWDADIAGADFSYAFFRCSPRHLRETRGIDVSVANFTNAVFFTPRFSTPED
jgi:BTB/POZ domain-containing protein KCTD9